MERFEFRQRIEDKGCLPELGIQLRSWRKLKYPIDSIEQFALRVGTSKSTYSKMEKGDLSVSIRFYLQAACLLKIEDRIAELFAVPRPQPRLATNITQPYVNLFKILESRKDKNLFDELDVQRSESSN
jgi:transcriptional regulator with XRE-family HTH domain